MLEAERWFPDGGFFYLSFTEGFVLLDSSFEESLSHIRRYYVVKMLKLHSEIIIVNYSELMFLVSSIYVESYLSRFR